MNKFSTTRAIILRRINYGEADRILTMLTSDYGKIMLIAKGVRKQKSRMAGGLELFGVSEINFIKGKGGMGTLTSSRIDKYFSNIVKDLDRTNVAYNLLKQSNEAIEEGMGQEYFDVLFDGLYALNSTNIEPELCQRGFDLRLMQMFGDLPDFAIGIDGSKLDSSLKFDFDAERLAFVPKEGGVFNVNHIKLIKLLAHNPTHKVAVVRGLGEYGRDIYRLVNIVSSAHRA